MLYPHPVDPVLLAKDKPSFSTSASGGPVPHARQVVGHVRQRVLGSSSFHSHKISQRTLMWQPELDIFFVWFGHWCRSTLQIVKHAICCLQTYEICQKDETFYLSAGQAGNFAMEVSTSWKIREREHMKALVCIVIAVGNQLSHCRYHVWFSANSTGRGWTSPCECEEVAQIHSILWILEWSTVAAAILCQATIAGPGPASNRTAISPCKFIQSHFLSNRLNQLIHVFSHRFWERDDELLVIASFKR